MRNRKSMEIQVTNEISLKNYFSIIHFSYDFEEFSKIFILCKLKECVIGLAILGKVQFHQTRTASSKTTI